MKWTTLKSGKHAGLSLPQIILADADWFFWVCEEGFFKGRLAVEAEDLAAKAQGDQDPQACAQKLGGRIPLRRRRALHRIRLCRGWRAFILRFPAVLPLVLS